LSGLYDPAERKHGIHAGEMETSVMLHLHEGLVAMDEADNFVPISVAMEESGAVLTPEGLVGFGWQAQDLHPSGACGNAAAADAGRGAETVERAASALVRLCREVSDYPIEQVTQKTVYNTP
ncbi:MAG: creatininase family protein, partial [Pseudomonadota bacterium]